jgi:hypothetical protein
MRLLDFLGSDPLNLLCAQTFTALHHVSSKTAILMLHSNENIYATFGSQQHCHNGQGRVPFVIRCGLPGTAPPLKEFKNSRPVFLQI